MSPVGRRGASCRNLSVCSDPGPLNMEFLTSDHRRNPKSHPKRRPLRRLRNLDSSRSEVANAKFLSLTIHMSRRSLQTDQITPYRQALGAALFRLQIPILTRIHLLSRHEPERSRDFTSVGPHPFHTAWSILSAVG